MLILLILAFTHYIYAQSDLEPKTYGPSQGRMPSEYAKQINNNINNINTAKFYAEKAISYFLNDACPLPKNLAGDFKDEQGRDAASMYRGNDGCNTLMLALYNLHSKYPEDTDCKSYLRRVIDFADCMLQYGTDRYGKIHSPLLASILIRGNEPYVPFDPENPEQGVRIEPRRVWNYSKNNWETNYCAVGVGNIWYGSDESHKANWRGADTEANSGLYTLLYKLSDELDPIQYPDKDKYKKAADASLAFWMNECQTESNLYPWGEHGGWDFYGDRYNNDYYHAPFHEYKGGFQDNLDKLIENQARVRPNELTAFEKYSTAFRATHTAEADYGKRYNGHLLEGMFLFCRHGTLWTDRITARSQPNNHDVGVNFGCFPKHIGSYIYLMAHAYNRSSNPIARDTIAKNLNYFLDGIEYQRTVYTDNQYYPYGSFDWNGYPLEKTSNAQNNNLGSFAKQASTLMEGLDNEITDKLLTVARNTNTTTNYAKKPYAGPAKSITISPIDTYTYFKATSVKLQWAKTDRAINYHIYLSTNKGEVAKATPDSSAFVKETANTEYLLNNLQPDATYYWAIDAINANGDITKGNIMIFSTSSNNATPIQSIHCEPASLVLDVNQSKKTQITFSPLDASNPFVRWKSLDEAIATVDSIGQITGKAAGNTIIQITCIDNQNITIDCPVTVRALNQEITFEQLPSQDISQNNYIELNASASSGLPVSYRIVSGPAILENQIKITPTECAYINGTTMTSQTLPRLKVGGMNTLFKIDLSTTNIPQEIDRALFEYVTVVDGHRRNFDVQVDMIEYPNTWQSGSSVPAPISETTVSNSITQTKIAVASSFPSNEEYVTAYQQPLALNITQFINDKTKKEENLFTLGLRATKTNSSDGEDYIRIGSPSHTDPTLHPRLIINSPGEGNVLKLTGTGTVTLTASQPGNSAYAPAKEKTISFMVTGSGGVSIRDTEESGIKIYPNPLINEDLNIITDNTTIQRIDIFNAVSQLIYTNTIESHQDICIPRSFFDSGFYIISFATENGILSYKLIVK